MPSRRILARTALRRSFAARGSRKGEYRFGERMMPARSADSGRVSSSAGFEK
jgi:hypothetical protein